MNVEAETLSSTMFNKFKKIDLELLFLKLFEVDVETIDDALVDRLPDTEVELIGVKWIDGNVERFGEASTSYLIHFSMVSVQKESGCL